MSPLTLLVLVFGGSCCIAARSETAMPWSGDLRDAKCNVDSVERANENQLADILEEMVSTQFFRLIRIDLNTDLCPFWKGASDESDATDEAACENKIESPIFGEPEKPACSLETEGHTFIPRFPTTDDIDRTLTKHEAKYSLNDDLGSNDPSMPGFWLDLLSNIWSNSSDFVNLQLNPERWTGYDGAAVWSAMYDENCFSRFLGGENGANEDKLCYEERVMYRLLSGMHTATNVHINSNYFPPRKGVRDRWEANPKRFIRQYGGKARYIQNMHFAFVVLLRAARRATPLLYNFSSPRLESDAQTLLRRLLDSQILRSCSPVFEAFDESLLFNDEFHNITTLKRQFKGVFQNVSSVLDCVTCEKCKLHAKVTVLGLGWALKVLLLPERMLVSALHEPEIVAFINTLHKFSTAIKHAKELALQFSQLSSSDEVVSKSQPRRSVRTTDGGGGEDVHEDVRLLETPAAPPSPRQPTRVKGVQSAAALDATIGMIANLRARSVVDIDSENKLIDLALAMSPGLFALSRHYADRPTDFARHALRNADVLASASYGVIDDDDGKRRAPVQAVLGSRELPADAVIVGSGLSGLAAALSVLDRGGSVVLIEKMGFFGGNSAKASSGINGVDPARAEEQSDSAAVFLSDMLKGGHCVDGDRNDDESSFKTAIDDASNVSVRSECALAPALVRGSGAALSWIRERVGMPLNKVGQLGGHSVPRTYRPSDGITGAELIFALSKKVKAFAETSSRGRNSPPLLRILLKTRAQSVSFRDENDDDEDFERAVESARCESADGDLLELFGRSVVLATGGFGSDFASDGSLIRKLRPELGDFATTNGKWATGDGHKMAMEAGAATVDLRSVQVHPTGFVDPKKPDAKVKTLCAELLRGVGGILLNAHGRRFANELGTRDYISGRMREEASASRRDDDPSRLHFRIVLNSASAAEADKHVPLYMAKGLLARYDNASSAARALDVSVDQFRRTILQYNSDASSGVDTFGKVDFAHAPWPLSVKGDPEGPFFVGTVTPVVHYCMGGLVTNSMGLVMSNRSSDVPVARGLYAVGELMGGIHGSNRLGGNALTECVVFGREVGSRLPIAAPTDRSVGERPHVRSTTEMASVTSTLREITPSELRAHGEEDDCWVAIHDKVYDFTDFAEDHPGGEESIFNVAGVDGTRNFDTVHTVTMLEEFEPIGVLVPERSSQR